ncbi:MAG: glycosyltransferase family 4 protein, partial [Bacteroidales bacterium]|nr:glycosyltransferase family 4 protein [Bacteroidales bacterium]
SYRSKFRQPAPEGKECHIPYLSIGNDLKLINLHRTLGYFIRGLRIISRRKTKGNSNVFYCIGPINIENILFVTWAKVLRYKIVFDINEDYSFFEDNVKAISKLKIRTTRILDVLTSAWAESITVVSTHLKKKYSARTRKPVILIPVTARQNRNQDRKIFNRPLQVIYAGTFDLKDGVETLIEGFLLFNRAFRDSQLILIGKSDLQEKYAKKYYNAENITFLGYVPDIRFYELLQNADVLCMCRTNSGFSNAGFPFKLGEYLATGNPVIATRASDVCDYLTPDDAYLIDFDSPGSIEAALQRIVENPDEAKQVGLNGFLKYRRHFSPESNGKLMLDMLMNL